MSLERPGSGAASKNGKSLGQGRRRHVRPAPPTRGDRGGKRRAAKRGHKQEQTRCAGSGRPWSAVQAVVTGVISDWGTAGRLISYTVVATIALLALAAVAGPLVSGVVMTALFGGSGLTRWLDRAR
ncbi:hypothetical protein [Allokutzneria sp. NRRL B-24872]|uniref:hypothetical protein n=1 Tax=Allokutzneria sp. NRRL B-24872 TaxID=1137961 RepID=UPI001177D81B|nr:hypothetical protein [Allokutzneria sp. NRRL B-24872]